MKNELSNFVEVKEPFSSSSTSTSVLINFSIVVKYRVLHTKLTCSIEKWQFIFLLHSRCFFFKDFLDAFRARQNFKVFCYFFSFPFSISCVRKFSISLRFFKCYFFFDWKTDFTDCKKCIASLDWKIDVRMKKICVPDCVLELYKNKALNNNCCYCRSRKRKSPYVSLFSNLLKFDCNPKKALFILRFLALLVTDVVFEINLRWERSFCLLPHELSYW